jgi:hypothetical protein
MLIDSDKRPVERQLRWAVKYIHPTDSGVSVSFLYLVGIFLATCDKE